MFTSMTHVYSLLISCLVHICSFVFSHLLYISYFIYFSPYLLKLVKFLSPLFISTFLLLLVLLTVLVNDNSFPIIIAKYNAILAKLHHVKDDESEEKEEEDVRGSEDLEMYKIFFGSSELMEEVQEKQIEVLEESLEKNEADKDSIHMREKRSDNFSKLLNQFERMSSNSEEKPQSVKLDKVAENQRTISISRHGSEVRKVYGSTVKAHSQRLGSNSPPSDHHDLGTYGSMREENEWNRTLACKLFEERRGVERDEGMDSLWETSYENDLPKSETEKNDKNKKIEDEDSEDEEVQLCCLQALKLSSSRKMSLGFGRPNLVKISKAIKGIGWLHHVKKHSKKVHNNGD
ncbi:hypothetical protein CASFOL_005694 [Castilleja foliolosa]|uniref:Transmembrane protein n=1 Tax=Castilleja foliolosa TaxID=1961234 RepID=A0ABD3E591_9LAMI